MVAKKIAKNAYIDWRFDQPNDFTLLGHKVASFANTKLVVDQIKRDGFTGIVLNTNVPIDPETGALKLYDDRPGAYNPDKNIPKDTWQVINYAKKNKLSVTINFNIVDYKTDNGIMSGNVGANFSTDTFFKAVGDYESKIAALAGRYKVDAIGIGSYQIGLDTDQYRSQWTEVIGKIKSKFKGQLSYSTDYRSDNALFGLVDRIGVGTGADIIDKNAVLSSISQLNQKYNKPVHWDPIFANATASGENTWNLLMSGQNLIDAPIRSDLQADRIREILKASIVDTPNSLAGLSFFEYAPWLHANWIQQPADDTGRQWNAHNKLASEFYKNQTASDTFTNWFNYSTNDVVGTRRNDTLKVYAGDKKVDGGLGKDTVVIHNSIKNCRITKDTINGGFDVDNGIGGIDGNYDMYNVEYVKFHDATVSLIGNNDLTKYGWF